MLLLELQKITKSFGGLKAIDNLDLDVSRGEIVGLIGPNGAGKTTVFNIITGIHRPTAGRVIFKGEDITGLRPDQVAAKGLVRTFQANVLFRNLTVLENVIVGCHLHIHFGFFEALVGTRNSRNKMALVFKRASEILELSGLSDLKGELAGNLPHGHQRALGLAIALAAASDLLVLDEPMSGMIAEEHMSMMAKIRRIRQEKGTTIIFIEHDMRAVLGLCDRVVVLNFGKKIAEGTPEEIRHNPEVIRAYLRAGTDAA